MLEVKKPNGRYLLLRQRVEFPGEKPIPLEERALQSTEPVKFSGQQTQLPKLTTNEKLQNHRVSPVPVLDTNIEDPGKIASTMIDLNLRPNRIHGQPSNTQGMNALSDSNHECASAVPVGSCNQDPEKYGESFPVSAKFLIPVSAFQQEKLRYGKQEDC